MTRQCKHQDCTTRASFGVPGSPPEFCASHCKGGMMDVRRKRCRAEDTSCSRVATYGYNTAEFCAIHANDDMVNIRHKTCAQRNCSTRPSFAQPGKRAEFCSRHARDGMVNVCSKSCAHQGCTVRPSFGQVGSTKAEFCLEHAIGGMVDVVSRRCAHPDCSKQPSFGIEGKKVEFCSGHMMQGMVNVVTKRCAHPDCNKQPSFVVPGSRKVEFCLTHIKDKALHLAAGQAWEGRDELAAQKMREDELGSDYARPTPAKGAMEKRREPSEVSAKKPPSSPGGGSSCKDSSQLAGGYRTAGPAPSISRRPKVVQQPPLPPPYAVPPRRRSSAHKSSAPSSVPPRSNFPDTERGGGGLNGDSAVESLPAHRHPHGVLSGVSDSTWASGKGKRAWTPVFEPPEGSGTTGGHAAAARWRPVFESYQQREGIIREREESGGGSSADNGVAVPRGIELAATTEGVLGGQNSSGRVRDSRREAFVPGVADRSAWRPVFGAERGLDKRGGGHEAGDHGGDPTAARANGSREEEEEQSPYETFQEFKARRSASASSGSSSSSSGSIRKKDYGVAREGSDPSNWAERAAKYSSGAGGVKVGQEIPRQLRQEEEQFEQQPTRAYGVHRAPKRSRLTA